MYKKEIILIAVMALVTLFTRALPFLVFRDKEKVPKSVVYLGEVLPYAIIAMLVVYCLKDFQLGLGKEWLAQIIAIIGIIFIHVKKRNTVLSIGAGTGLYLLLVQIIL